MRSIVIVSTVAVALAAAYLLSATTFMAQQLSDPHIVVHKSARMLKLYDGKKLVKTYKVVLGFSPLGDKVSEGDGRTPEGDFYVFVKNDKSRFTLSLGVSYPSTDDAERGVKANLISKAEEQAIRTAIRDKSMPPQKTKLGGEIYIHGGGTDGDWTDGCIAMNDSDITELFALANTGMRVSILP
jgi:murein L,D-transpeptidase YafK